MTAATRGLPVLMYHAVGSPMPPGLGELSVPPGLLAEQLSALAGAGYELLGLTDALAARGSGRKVVGLTFDDGYRDFLDAAVPVLADLRAGATLYVPSRNVGGTADWLPGSGAALPLLDARGVAAVAELGIEVGSHGAVHVPMDVLPRAVAASHLGESRTVLEGIVGQPVVSFCYPHGYASPVLRRQVHALGYDNACVIGHRVSPPGEDPTAVSRLLVGPQHDPRAVLDLVAGRGPRSVVPALKRAATPAWRATRRTARLAGATWT
ncbi:polysaccharide deacetylase family protein [Nocardioides sp. SOB77]|uniref:Polysaccharide deacetylase family protein n=1 Tax=Nocardioides oceani TaxID=3058369 RepID=A0ABT8FK22_9ACTN|nr:polysaccharide deacetylase family protein [Nocardioides oceani]MDN4174795.1 polysaccharide deacetylase family protein [Nocardioides oceani]